MLKTGRLAYEHAGVRLPLQILKSEAGYYIGTADESGPVSRESLEYWQDGITAETALRTGNWCQRDCP